MDQRTCSDCGVPFDGHANRRYCTDCRPRRDWRKYKTRANTPKDPPPLGQCAECGASMGGGAVRKYCGSRCRNAASWRRRPRALCKFCGEQLGWVAGNPRGQGASHPRCRPNYLANSRKAKGGMDSWECAGCGAHCERPRSRGQRPKWCSSCRSKRGGGCFVTPTIRMDIYKRDGWACGLCGDPVDASLIGSRDPWRPSLDHIVPRSHGGPDSPENLRLAHAWCNSVRGAGVNDDLFEEVA